MVLASIIDISERKKAEERFRLVVESAPNAMILVNPEGKITLINNQTEKLFGYQRDELIGNKLEILIPNKFRESHPHLRKSFFPRPPFAQWEQAGNCLQCEKMEQSFRLKLG
jgi:PAS domain S-box-containing protein